MFVLYKIKKSTTIWGDEDELNRAYGPEFRKGRGDNGIRIKIIRLPSKQGVNYYDVLTESEFSVVITSSNQGVNYRSMN
jgi:hypothetical protein